MFFIYTLYNQQTRRIIKVVCECSEFEKKHLSREVRAELRLIEKFLYEEAFESLISHANLGFLFSPLADHD